MFEVFQQMFEVFQQNSNFEMNEKAMSKLGARFDFSVPCMNSINIVDSIRSTSSRSIRKMKAALVGKKDYVPNDINANDINANDINANNIKINQFPENIKQLNASDWLQLKFNLALLSRLR